MCVFLIRAFVFSSALELDDVVLRSRVVFLAVLIEAGLVFYSSLIVFRGQGSSGSAGYLPFVTLTDRTSASPTARSASASSTSSQRKSSLSCSCLKACGLFRDALPVVWNRGRLDPSRKQVQCHRCFLFARRCLPSESLTKHVDALRESSMFAPAVVFGTNDEVTHYRKLAESEGKRFQRRRSLCEEAFCFFQVALGRAPGLYTQCVCQVTIVRYSAFLNGNRLYPLFLFKCSFRRAIIQLEFQESKPKPEGSHSEESQRHRRYTRCVLWAVTMYAHLSFKKLGFLAVQPWPIVLLKYSLTRALLQIEFRWSKPDESHSEKSKTETRKTAFCSSETLKSHADDGLAAAGCPSLTQTIIDHFAQLLSGLETGHPAAVGPSPAYNFSVFDVQRGVFFCLRFGLFWMWFMGFKYSKLKLEHCSS